MGSITVEIAGAAGKRLNAEDAEWTRRSQRRPDLRVLCAPSANSAFQLENACGVSTLSSHAPASTSCLGPGFRRDERMVAVI
jgi:hypothetical protein